MKPLVFSLLLALMLPLPLSAFCFEEAGQLTGVDRRLLEKIAQVESNMNPRALHVNRDGSRDLGLMQINSFWIGPLSLDPEELVSNACYNVKAGARVLKQCIERYGYNWDAVGCYNASDRAKRADYAWKVFFGLQKEGKLPEPNRESPEVVASPSLLFEAKDGSDK